MLDERAYIARIESADPDELVELLRQPDAAQEKALRVHLGDERYRRLRSLVLVRGTTRGRRSYKGNVVVIPGALGSELTAFGDVGEGELVWLSAGKLAQGQLAKLRLAEDGRSDFTPGYEVRATGIMKRHYGELLLTLSKDWNVRAFWYDWRKDLKLAAAELEAQISGWFDEEAPVHLVALGTGGLVARTFIKNNPDRWATMWDGQGAGLRGGRLVMLGTPNHGSFTIAQILTGVAPLIDKLDLLINNREMLVKVIQSFVGLYQLLPSPFEFKSAEPLYKAEIYGELQLSQRLLDGARRHHQSLRDVVDASRMLLVLGSGVPTWSKLAKGGTPADLASYELTLEGDGLVTHDQSELKEPGAGPLPAFYIVEEHGNLPSNKKVLASIGELLERGTTTMLGKSPSALRGASSQPKSELRERISTLMSEEASSIQTLAGRVSTRGAQGALTSEERKLEEMILHLYLSFQDDKRLHEKLVAPFGPARIEIGLVYGGIDSIDYPSVVSSQGLPVDAVAVGHYLGEKPAAAERAIDRAISRVLPGKVAPMLDNPPAELPEADLVLTQYAERGTIRGDLGQIFVLPDPRGNDAATGRVIVVAGMGVPGRFGMPELTVLSRELCWAIGRMGKRHLSTVLIGSGKGNLSEREAVSAWIRGLKNALSGSLEDDQRHLLKLTFVEIDPRRLQRINEALVAEKNGMEQRGRLQIDYTPLSEEQLASLREEAFAWERREWEQVWEQQNRKQSYHQQHDDRKTGNATRMSLALERKTYRFGAITEAASIPEREIPLDPSLVIKANDELAAETDPVMQLERGQFMERLLIPEDLRVQLYTDAPLVLMLDSTTARIHWELLAQSELAPSSNGQRSAGVERQRLFLGTSRGLTRQLRSTFAPPPEPPPPPRRVLRVLVVADPAEDARLPGAEQEGVEVAELFERFNTVYEGRSENMVEVVRLFGPREATRTNVLRHLILRSYDVLHFAGHCVYDREDIFASGWIFTGGERLTANELKRIDRIPKFVFSNACESGITPDRAEQRSVELAPTFAEAFFARGVSNFVCTAWPVDDGAARQFARRLYSGLLGLVTDGEPECMYMAMREARREVAELPNGMLTWGAYQHYGNPYLRFFDPVTMCLKEQGPQVQQVQTSEALRPVPEIGGTG